MKLTDSVFRVIVFFLVQVSLLGAEEFRTWTSLRGALIEAKFQKLESGRVHLLTTDSKIVRVKIEDLSIVDRHHMVKNFQIDQEMFNEVRVKIPEKVFQFQRETSKAREDTLSFGDNPDLEFELLESEHFFIAYKGRVRPHALAEMAERVWHGMASRHASFRKNWGDEKQVVIVTADDETYFTLGDYYTQWIADEGANKKRAAKESERLRVLWGNLSGVFLQLTKDQAEHFGAARIAKIFRIRDGRDFSYKKVFGPFPTHELSVSLALFQMGGRNPRSPKGYFAIARGYSFFKEIQLAGKSETLMVDLNNNDEILDSVRNFEEGQLWAKTLKKFVRIGNVKPDLLKLLSYTPTHLTPEELMLVYSFGYYMQSDAEKIVSFSHLLEKTREDYQVPDAVEVANIFGFDSVEEFNEDWTKFVSSPKFK